ncbi:MAG: hypothetical protein JWN23_2572 [Rhodocyclales bacterium]|nr:hypothetical protein [Rhodocyclales bacterium]
MLLTAAVGPDAAAQALPGTVMPEALKNIKAASGVCPRDDVVANGNPETGANNARPDMSCAIRPAELSSLLTSPDTTIVDLRNLVEYNRVRIDGSLNLATSEVRRKNYLHDKSLVLVGNGKAERELYMACADLQTRGFKRVKVLQGGMPAWLFQKQKVIGENPEILQSIELSPSELWIESQFDANLMLVSKEQESMQRLLSFSSLIPDESPVAVKTVIERWRKELKNSPLASVVLITSPRKADADSMQRLRQAIQPIPLLVYVGTREAFEKQIAQQKAIWTAQARGPKKPGCGL